MSKSNNINMEVTSDVVFQRIFGKVGNENITKGFLENILGIEIDELTLDTNKRLIGEKLENKTGRLDVKAKLKDGTKVLIEMQTSNYAYMPERLLYYWAETYTGDLNKGDYYTKLEKTIAILVITENLKITNGIDKYHTIWTLREEENLDKQFTKDMEIHVLELDKYTEGKNDTVKEGWIRFIKDGGNAKMDKKVSDKALEEAREELKRLTADPEMQEIYYQRIKDLRDMLSFAEDAREKGLQSRSSSRKTRR